MAIVLMLMVAAGGFTARFCFNKQGCGKKFPAAVMLVYDHPGGGDDKKQSYDAI